MEESNSNPTFIDRFAEAQTKLTNHLEVLGKLAGTSGDDERKMIETMVDNTITLLTEADVIQGYEYLHGFFARALNDGLAARKSD